MRRTLHSALRSTRKDRHVARTREAILDAATRAFARRGFQAATMHDIAREADYTAPSLYNYFASKEQILDALLARLQASFLGTFDEPPPAGLGFAQRLDLLLGRQLELADRSRDAIHLLVCLQTGTAAAEALARRHTEAFRDVIRRLAQWLRQAARDGDLGGRDPEEAALALWGLVHGFHVRWLLLGRPARISQLRPLLLDLFLHGVRGRPTARPRRRLGD